MPQREKAKLRLSPRSCEGMFRESEGRRWICQNQMEMCSLVARYARACACVCVVETAVSCNLPVWRAYVLLYCWLACSRSSHS